jgi:hypothetical protein
MEDFEISYIDPEITFDSSDRIHEGTSLLHADKFTQEVSDKQNCKIPLEQYDLVRYSKDKRNEFNTNSSTLPYLLIVFLVISLIVLATPINPRTLSINAFNFYPDALRNPSLTSFYDEISFDFSALVPWHKQGESNIFAGFSFSLFLPLTPVFLQLTFLIIYLFPFFISRMLTFDHQKLERLETGQKEEIDFRIKKVRKTDENLLLYVFILVGLLPVIGFSIASRTYFTAGTIDFVTGIFVGFYAHVALIATLITHVFMLDIRDKLFRKQYVDEYIICLLAECLEITANRSKWRTVKSRKWVKNRLDTIADIFQEDMPDQMKVRDPVCRKNYQLIASKFRSLSQWLLTPKQDTRDMLEVELLNILESYIDFDLDSLIPKQGEVELISKRPITGLLIREIAFKGIKMMIPIIFTYLFLMAPIAPTGPLRDYLVLGVFVLTGLRIISEIDPGFGEALDALLDRLGKGQNLTK